MEVQRSHPHLRALYLALCVQLPTKTKKIRRSQLPARSEEATQNNAEGENTHPAGKDGSALCDVTIICQFSETAL